MFSESLVSWFLGVYEHCLRICLKESQVLVSWLTIALFIGEMANLFCVNVISQLQCSFLKNELQWPKCIENADLEPRLWLCRWHGLFEKAWWSTIGVFCKAICHPAPQGSYCPQAWWVFFYFLCLHFSVSSKLTSVFHCFILTWRHYLNALTWEAWDIMIHKLHMLFWIRKHLNSF